MKFSLERYCGASARLYREKVQAVEIVDAHLVRIRLKEPWPDFMTFYGTPSTGAGWIVPKKYVEQVGDDGFKKHPIGAGPRVAESGFGLIPLFYYNGPYEDMQLKE